MIRRLNPITDDSLFMQVYGWLEDSPRWRQESEGVWGSTAPDEWLAATHDPTRIDIGVWDAGELVGDIVLVLRAVGVYEAHLHARRGTKAEVIVEAVETAAAQLFGEYGAESVFAWVPTFNRAMRRIIKAIGFRADGITMWRGTCRGRLVEWTKFTMEAADGRT